MTTQARFRRLVCALALPGFPLALLAGTLVAPTDSTDNTEQLRAAAAHPGTWQASALLELLAAALLPLAVAGAVQAIRGRGSTLATVAGGFGVLGTLGMTLIAARHLFIYGLSGIDVAAASHVLDRVDNGAGTIAFFLMFGGPIALITVAGAAVRSGIVPRWALAGAFLFVVSDMLPVPGAELLQALLGVFTFGVLAHRILRLPSEPRASFGRPGGELARTSVSVGA